MYNDIKVIENYRTFQCYSFIIFTQGDTENRNFVSLILQNLLYGKSTMFYRYMIAEW